MRAALIPFAAAGLLLISACGSSSPTASNSPAPSSSPSASAAAAPSSTLDPCQVLTASEASALAGASYSSGKATALSGSSSACVYGAQTANVVQVIVAQASDPASAQAQWTQEQAKAEAQIQQGLPPGASLNTSSVSVSGADKAAIASYSATIGGQVVGIIAIYLLKGSVFLTFSDLAVGHQAASASAMQAQGATSLGRLP